MNCRRGKLGVIGASLAIVLAFGITPVNRLVAADVTVNVDATQVHQTWYGFGCTHSDGIFGPIDTMTAAQRAQYVDMLFNQVRIRTGQIPSAFEAPANSGVNFFTNQANDDNDPFSINWGGFCTFTSDQFKATVVDLAAMGTTADLYPATTINTRWASKWLETIRTRDYSTFLDECAEQVLAQITVFKNTFGREPLYAELFNEPTSGNGELVNGTDAIIADIVARCGDRLRANGFNTVKFVVPAQETEEKSLATAQAIMANPGAAQYVGAIAFHTYPYGSTYSYIPNILSGSGRGTSDSSRILVRNQLRDLGKQYGVPVWMTEVSNGFVGDNTQSNLDSFDALRGRAIHIHDEMLYAEAAAFFGMNGNWSIDANKMHFGNGAVGANPDDIIFVDQPNNRVFITGMGRAIGHYARFINKGAQILTSTSTNSLVQVTSANDSASGALAVVLINNDNAPHTLTLNVTGLTITGNVSGEQSTSAAYWQSLTPFAVKSATSYEVVLPALSVTSLAAPTSTSNNQPPVITSGPSGTPNSVTVGQAIAFTVAALDPDGDPIAYSWDFGDGSSGSGNTLSHTYASAGNYTAMVTLDDGRGGRVNAIVDVSVSSAKPNTYALMVNSGSGGGSYSEGTVVTIRANPDSVGQIFDHWTGAAVANAYSTTTTLIMPAAATFVTATYKVASPPQFTLTVNNGSGSGSYAAGTIAAISAHPAPSGQIFAEWTGAAVADASSPTTTLTMPDSSSTVTATYKTQPPPPDPLILTKLTGTVDFSAPGRDRCSTTGTIGRLPVGFAPLGATVTLDVAGAKVSFKLDTRGNGKTGANTFALRAKNGSATFTAQLNNGSFASAWFSAGIVNVTESNVKTALPVALLGIGNGYAGSRQVLYTAHRNKGGTFK